ncbi:MAG: SPOR domain-containing protein [Candidatus Krumholzibacteria bacterium]|nr:SPOR domain-containing protein [Candidatus Krumholzibacteria bacterium]
MGDEERGMSEEGRRGDHVEGGFSILLGDENIRAFMSSGDFSSARELDRFLELGARIEGRLTEDRSHTILAMSVGENRLARDFAVLQISHILAKHGRDVLIVDFDFLSPGLSGLVENTEDQGFLDLLLYGSSMKTVAKPTGIDGVTVVGPGSFPVSRTIPFAKKEFTKVKEFLSRSHGVIIYCSTLYTDDGTINPLASLADSIFLSCRLEEMPEGQFQKNLGDLGSDLPPAELVCFGEDVAGSAGEIPCMPPLPVDDEPAEEGAESVEEDGQEEQYEAAAIEKTAELESDGKRGSGGMNLPRIITSGVVVFVVVFLVWWFMIHKSITNKEGESRTAELVQKQLDVKEMKDRSQDETAVSGTKNEAGEAEDNVVSVTGGGDVDAEAPVEKPADKPAEEKIAAQEPAADETGTDRSLPESKPGTVTPAPEGSYYSVHVASFREISRAGTETDYLEKKGYEAVVITKEVSGQRWYRVYVGEFGTKEEAAAARLQLLDLSRIGYAKVVTLKNSNN